MPPSKKHDFLITTDHHHDNLRLDSFLAEALSLSRNNISGLIKQGFITVNGRPGKPALKLKPGQIIAGRIPPKEDLSCPSPEYQFLDILFEDDHLIVINKPAPMVVHPAPGHTGGTLVNALLNYYPEIKTVGEPDRPGLVHRLDRDTTGVLVAARSAIAYKTLSAMFAERKIKKQYLTVTYGKPAQSRGTIELPLGRHPVHRKKMSVAGINKRTAESSWRILKDFTDAGLLEVGISTGRTHQIRVHCAAAGFPVVGDMVYGARWTTRPSHFHNRDMFQRLRAVSRQMLHAWKLSLDHPVTNQSMKFIAPLPSDMKILLRELGRLIPKERATDD